MEIKVQRKKKPVWPWILALVVLLVIIWILYTQFDDEIEQQFNDNSNNNSYVVPDNNNLTAIDQDEVAFYEEVKAFNYFVEQNNEHIDSQPEYTVKAIHYLSAALSGMVDREYVGDNEIEEKRNELLLATNRLSDSLPAYDSLQFKLAFNHAADLMAYMQKKDYPEVKLQIKHIEKIAETLQADLVKPQQNLYIKEFFMVARDALQAFAVVDTF